MDNGRGGYRQQQQRRRFAPIKVGDEAEVTIEAIGEKGDGVAKVKGFVLFIANAKQGQTYKVRVTRVLSKVGFAEIVGEGSAKEESAEEDSEQEEEEAESTEEDTFEGEEDN
ncbi:MAG: TRAM domain-containing protein [Nanoarchaeota archaeon]